MATAFNGATAAFEGAAKQGGLRCVRACVCAGSCRDANMQDMEAQKAAKQEAL